MFDNILIVQSMRGKIAQQIDAIAKTHGYLLTILRYYSKKMSATEETTVILKKKYADRVKLLQDSLNEEVDNAEDSWIMNWDYP